MRQSFECRHIYLVCFGGAYADIVGLEGGVCLCVSVSGAAHFLCHSGAVSKCCVMSLLCVMEPLWRSMLSVWTQREEEAGNSGAGSAVHVYYNCIDYYWSLCAQGHFLGYDNKVVLVRLSLQRPLIVTELK